MKPKKRRRKDDSEDEDEVEEEEQNPDDDVANPEEEGKDNQEVVDETSAENETGDNIKLGVADRNDVPSSIDSSNYINLIVYRQINQSDNLKEI